METTRSKQLFELAKQLMPGGVNSPVRAFRSVGMDPLFVARAKGSHIYDVDGNDYIDYVASWGPMICGHANDDVLAAVRDALEMGTSYGAPTELEVQMARMVIDAVPSIEEVRMVSSGTEAVMSAIRLARGYTGKNKIIKFEGCYHGHSDAMLVHAGSGVTTLGLPDSPGVTDGAVADTISLPYNDVDAVRTAIDHAGEDIAAIILEPVAGNMGVVPPADNYLRALRKITEDAGILLIFDEVITGFRVGYGGAQGRFGIEPDLTTLGKIIGGGFPVGAFGGKRCIMEHLAPAGTVYQAGTLSGNPIAMTAGIATLKLLSMPGTYEKLEALGARLADGLKVSAEEAGIAAHFTRVGAMSCMFFTDTPVVDYATAKTSNTERYAKYFRGMLDQGIYLAPSQFEACFVSTAHSEEEIDRTLEASREAMKGL